MKILFTVLWLELEDVKSNARHEILHFLTYMGN